METSSDDVPLIPTPNETAGWERTDFSANVIHWERNNWRIIYNAHEPSARGAPETKHPLWDRLKLGAE